MSKWLTEFQPTQADVFDYVLCFGHLYPLHVNCTVKPVLKDHPWEVNKLVFVHRWSLIAGSFKQKISIWETKSIVAIDRELLFKRLSLALWFDCISFFIPPTQTEHASCSYCQNFDILHPGIPKQTEFKNSEAMFCSY